MAQMAQKGYTVEYRIHELRSIKPVQHGEMKDSSTGDKIKYGSSVQFRTYNIEQVEDDVVGLVDRETTLVFKIPTVSDAEAKILNTWLRSLDVDKNPLLIVGTLPKLVDRDTYQVTCSLSVKDLMSVNPVKDK